HVDFAGSSVVHMTGGVMAFVTAALLGPRRGKYNFDGSVNAIPGHNIPMALIGTFILAFGWFGFNAGSTLAGSDLRIGVIATNTMLAGAAGGITSMLYMWFKYGKPDPSMMANGTLAGLVAITAPCAFVTAPSAVLIGGIAGVLVCVAVFFIDGKLRIDDPVGAISVHGVNGLWGILALGLLADGTYGDGWNGVNGAVRGRFYGDASQFIAQAIGGVANVVGVGAMHGGGTGRSPEGGHGMRVQGRSLALAALVGVCLTAAGLLRARSGAPTPVDSAAKKPDPPPLAGFKLTGFAAGSYAYSGRSSGDTAIVGRLYDRLQNRFMLNALAVVLDKPYDPAKFSAGFHTELLVGQDATVIQSGGFNLGSQADLPICTSR